MMKRKEFLKRVGHSTLYGGMVLTGLSGCKKDNEQRPAEDCKLTGPDDLGPFFVAGSSNIVNLNTQNLPGTPMMVSGKVFSGEGASNPIENAKIEIWHADSGGRYHPEGSGDVSDYEASQITLRGFVLTPGDGSYSFQSILPGLYGGRARHIHYRISASDHDILVTQSYFLGDARIQEDPLSQNAGDCRIISFQDNGSGTQVGIVNFNIKKS
ncbi:hypothetical protein QQ008_24905 [Fulvivirgaceae bacterium BMA10]|uniref:Intradiol ring-cleavage dioxygenases domain-containing protein n=1 Tax=Splendidivirga corallicola TaxID=3051826 RepID=A0ABT8KV55_9BACT|nr:hypothetical protein [Fulvivirgaceae bacterium BMA10]